MYILSVESQKIMEVFHCTIDLHGFEICHGMVSIKRRPLLYSKISCRKWYNLENLSKLLINILERPIKWKVVKIFAKSTNINILSNIKFLFITIILN